MNPKPCHALGKTLKNVNCFSVVDLLIILLSRISVEGKPLWFLRSKWIVHADLKPENNDCGPFTAAFEGKSN